MREPFSETERQDLRRKLITVIEAGALELGRPIADDTPLIKSGRLDSLGLFNVAVFIEREVGHKLDITSFDLATAWDTVAGILDFIEQLLGQ